MYYIQLFIFSYTLCRRNLVSLSYWCHSYVLFFAYSFCFRCQFFFLPFSTSEPFVASELKPMPTAINNTVFYIIIQSLLKWCKFII